MTFVIEQQYVHFYLCERWYGGLGKQESCPVPTELLRELERIILIVEDGREGFYSTITWQ